MEVKLREINNFEFEEADDEAALEKCCFEDALDKSGFGKYNYGVLSACCLLILEMYTDIFGFSVLLPSVACDLNLSPNDQGILSAIPLVGVMASSYAWGLCADTLGRRKTMIFAMPVGLLFTLLTSIAPNFTSLCLLKFLSAGFSSSANAAAFVLLGETVPRRHRSRFMFLMASATMVGQLFICLPALPVFTLKFHIYVSWLDLEYRPWRLLIQILCIPGVVGIIGMVLLEESPKFLLSKGLENRALEVLKKMYHSNTGLDSDMYPVRTLSLERSEVKASTNSSFLRHMWNQTAPLFQPPLLKHSLMLYFILLCAYMTSTGFTMWVPTMTNAYFSGEDTADKTFCEILTSSIVANKHSSRYSNHTSSSYKDCDYVIKPLTLYAVMVYSGLCGTLNLLLTFLVGPLGKKKTTLLVFIVCITCGVILMFIRVPMLSILMFYVFPYVALILGNINSYLVELNPTYLRGNLRSVAMQLIGSLLVENCESMIAGYITLSCSRGMATCLSVVVARGFGFGSVQLIGSLLVDNCEPMIAGYIILVLLGLITACFLPPDTKEHKNRSKSSRTPHTYVNGNVTTSQLRVQEPHNERMLKDISSGDGI